MQYAKGQYAYFICQRSGQKTRQCDGVFEPGTGLAVHKDWSDGIYNAVTHPQSKPPINRRENLPQRFAFSGKSEAYADLLLTEDLGQVITDENGFTLFRDVPS